MKDKSKIAKTGKADGDMKRVDEALNQSNAYNQSLIDASPGPLVTIGPDGKIMDVNKPTQVITGCASEELIGSDFSGYFTDPSRAQAVFGDTRLPDY